MSFLDVTILHYTIDIKRLSAVCRCLPSLPVRLYSLCHSPQLTTAALAHHVGGLVARKGGNVRGHHLQNALPRLQPLPTDVRREQHVVERPERAVGGRAWRRRGSLAEDVQRRPGNTALAQRLDRRIKRIHVYAYVYVMHTHMHMYM